MAKPNWENRTLFHGDNLDFMLSMDSGTVDLIATDPPFNKNKDFHATPDSLAKGGSFQDRWKWGSEHDAWLESIKDDNPQLGEAIESAIHAHSESMGAFVCFLSVRLMQMHRLLKPTGSLFLHCDPTASHYIRACLDSIFGYKNYRNEIIWHHPKIGVASRKFTSNTDTIFFYTKSDLYLFIPQKLDEPNELYNRWKRKITNGILYYREAKTIKDSPAKSKIRQREKALGRELRDDDVVVDFNDPENWKVVDNVWKQTFLRGNSKENCGYPTQKPLILYKRIIEATTETGGVVLDPFAGCATTCVAAEILGRQWVGIDLWGEVAKVVRDRMDKAQLQVMHEDILLTKRIPKRRANKEKAVPYLRTPLVIQEPPDGFRTRAERVEFLIDKYGLICQGCGRGFDHRAYLQLDHITPRADGGWHHIKNRCLLCGPCNGRKSHKLTLSGLRDRNKKEGFMHDEAAIAKPG